MIHKEHLMHSYVFVWSNSSLKMKTRVEASRQGKWICSYYFL